MLSVELQILIECCKVSLLQSSNSTLIDVIENQKISWDRLSKMVVFHSIRPTVYHALRTMRSEQIDTDLLHALSDDVKLKSIHSIFFSTEINKIKALFDKHQIAAICYKGLNWSQLLYKNTFREGADMDFLIDKNKVFEALNLLIKDGYQLGDLKEYSREFQPEELLRLLIENERVEIPLTKKNSYGFTFKFDFHWDVLIKPQSYGFDIHEVFTDKFDEKEKLLLIMILHSGKKEAWSKLKYISDLVLFVYTYGRDFNWDLFLNKLNHPSTEKSLLRGLGLVSLFLPLKKIISINKEIPQADTLTISYWEKALHYEINLKARFHIFLLKLKSQINFKESYYYFSNYFRYLSYPTPQARRLVQFPRSYKFLNLASTVVSFLFFSAFKRIK